MNLVSCCVLPTLFLFLATAFSPLARAFETSLPTSSVSDSLRQQVLTTWTTDQGLPQNFVRAITQTSDGFIWIGTMNGLVRFDGLRFRAPGPDLHGNISGLEPDGASGLWAATNRGLFHLEHHRFEQISIAGNAPAPILHVEAIARSHSGELWVYSEKRLYLTHNNVLEPRPLPAGAAAIRDLAESTDGTLWLADGESVFAMKAAVTATTRAVRFPLAGARMLCADDFGSLYAGDGHKLYRFNGGTQDHSPFSEVRNPGLGNFVNVLVDHEHHLWMASGGLHGLSRKIDSAVTNTARIETLTTEDGIVSNDVRVLFEDRSHDLWIGTIAGLQRLHHGIFTTYSNAGIGSKPQFESIFQGPDGTIWAGTLESGIMQLPSDPSQPWRRFARPSGLRIGQIRGFAEDRLATSPHAVPVVAIADYGLFSYRDGRFALMPGVPSGYVGTPIATQDGSLWFVIQRRGIFRRKLRKESEKFEPDKREDKRESDEREHRKRQGTGSAPAHSSLAQLGITQVGTEVGLPADPNLVWTLALDSQGDLWAGAGTQLYRWNGTRFDLVLTAPSPILCITRSRKPGVEAGQDYSGLVVGTLDGLYIAGNRSSGRQPRSLTERDGLPGSTVVDVLEDDDDNLWIATARAIARISHAQWSAFSEGRLPRIQPEIYTRADGLHSNTVLPLNQITAIRAHDGRTWFATSAGISVLNPEADTARMSERADALIDTVTVDDREQPISEDSALVVAPGQHRITFAFTTPPVPAPEQIRFRYRLSGWDDHWLDAGDAREVSYTALPPGSYTYEVKAIARGGISSNSIAAVQVRLNPFFWQTRWFLGLSIVVAALILVEITRRRTRASAERLSFQFQERAAERERIAYQIHDTVIQDMVGTVLQLELLGFELSEKPEKASSNLGHLTQRLRDTVARSRNMVWSLHSTSVVQYSLVEVLRHAEAEFRLGELPDFELSSNGEPREIHPLIRDEVYRICREALANAFRHSNARRVHVIVRFLPDMLEVEIGDDGDGIQEEIRLHGRPGHFGLPGMQAHAQRIDAAIQIVSAPGQGTQILLRVRTRRTNWGWPSRWLRRLSE
jgi:signal transduction histidine kinase/ligand-binding sensor domain-containing protein